MKKTKGFTLIEIIATVAILGIMSVIAIVSVNGIVQKGKEEHYKSIEENSALATESYVQTNRDDLPKNIGEKKKITVGIIIQTAYALPKSRPNSGAIIKFVKIKKAKTAVKGKL